MPPNIHREHYSYSLESHQDSFQFLSSPASFFLFFRFIISLLSYLTYIYIFSPSGIFGCHADSLQHGRFVIQRNFIPPPYAEESQQLPREEENLFYSFESCDPRLLFRLGTFSPLLFHPLIFFGLRERRLLSVCWREAGISGGKETPHPVRL
jgi:hypothetical protein